MPVFDRVTQPRVDHDAVGCVPDNSPYAGVVHRAISCAMVHEQHVDIVGEYEREGKTKRHGRSEDGQSNDGDLQEGYGPGR